MQRSTISAAEICSLRDPCFCYPLADQFVDFGIVRGVTICRRICTSQRRFSDRNGPVSHRLIFDKRLTDAGLFQMAIFLADAPADVEPREIAGGERSHGHAEIGERLIDGFDAGAFFDQKLRLAAVRAEHAIADKAAAIADEHADFAEVSRKLHAGGDHFLAGGFAADDFEQTHHVRRAEEMRADDGFGREVAEAISSILSVEVLLARMAPGLQTRSSSLKISFLRAMPSKTASMTKSTLLKSS